MVRQPVSAGGSGGGADYTSFEVRDETGGETLTPLVQIMYKTDPGDKLAKNFIGVSCPKTECAKNMAYISTLTCAAAGAGGTSVAFVVDIVDGTLVVTSYSPNKVLNT